ncbi:16S rRNA (cytosine(967)-C(5))-methyltransferase RsmB [Thermodesulfobacteriota bacterium]
MSAKSPRDLALKVLNDLNRSRQYAAIGLDQTFQRRSELEPRDRAFITHLVLGVVRWRLKLDWIIAQVSSIKIEKISPPILNILRLAVFQILFLDRVPESAAVNEAVNQAKGFSPRRISSFVNGILRNLCRKKNEITFPDRESSLIEHLSIKHSFPAWLVERWVRDFSLDFAEGLLAAANRLPRLTIRVNTLKTSRQGLIDRLNAEGVAAKPTTYMPSGIELKGLKRKVDQLNAFKEGLFQVQDQAAQIPSYILSPSPGETVLDICSGLGGKSTHLAEFMENQGIVLTLDINPVKLIKLNRNSRRLGIDSLLPLAADASKSLSSLFHKKFDKILLDAPCSGFGVISRHPDGKWNKKEVDIERLAGLQKAMINAAASVLKRNGRLLYVTCTLSKEENEDVVEDCLRNNKALSLENIREHIPGWGHDLIDGQGFLQTFPPIHGMDGFFSALFLKN